MIELIKFDLINRLKKPITWFVIIVLCIMIGANFLDIQEDRKSRPFVEHNTIGVNSALIGSADDLFDERERDAYPMAYQAHKLSDQLGLDMLKAIAEKNYREMTRLISFWNLLTIKETRMTVDPISDILVKNDIYHIWIDVADDIPYDSVDFRPFNFLGGWDVGRSLLEAEYYRDLYINDFEPIYNDEVNNLNTIYSYFLNIGPIIIFLVVILFTYNNINSDKNNGRLKLVLTQSISRGKYYFSKWISSVLHILTMFFIPPIIMSIIGGFMGGFISFKYPVFYINNVFTRLIPIPNYFEQIEKSVRAPELLPRVFGHLAPNYTNMSISPHADVDIISFYKYIILVIILTVLFVMFLVAFVQLISAIVNHEIVSMVTSVGLIAVFIFIGQPFAQGDSYNFNPFMFSNASRIVQGTLNVTFLTGTLIMLLSTCLLLAIGYRYFKKKEI